MNPIFKKSIITRFFIASLFRENPKVLYVINALLNIPKSRGWKWNAYQKLLLIFLTVGFQVQYLFGQSNIPVGTWKFHQFYKGAAWLSGNDQTVFARSGESLFFYSINEDQSYTLTANDGLYGQSFTASGFDGKSKTLIVAYPDGTLDRIGEKSIDHITALRNNNLITEKRINKIKLINDTFYLAADFGLALLDPATGQFREAYLNIGPDGNVLAVRDVGADAQHLYLATSSGVLKGDPSMNLKDFRNWELIKTELTDGFVEAESLDGQLFLIGSDKNLYLLTEDGVELILGTEECRNLKKIGNDLFFIKDNNIYQLEASGSFSLFLQNNYTEISDFHFSGNDSYLSVPGKGLVRHEDQMEIKVPGPQAKIQQFYWDEAGTLAFPVYIDALEGIIQSGNIGSSKLTNGFWEDLQAPGNVMAKADLGNITYFGTMDDGLWKVADGQLQKVELLEERLGETVGAFSKDQKNQLWVGFYDSRESLLKFDASGKPRSIAVPGLQYVHKIIADNAHNLWILQSLPSGIRRLRAFNENTNLNRQLIQSDRKGAGEILDMDLDTEGNLWLGLTNGVAYISNVSSVNAGSEIIMIQPLIDNRNLLDGQVVNAVQVAADQTKWFGTQNDGLWHFSASGDELLEHFSELNSPLPSNSISNLEIDAVSGELLIVVPNAALAYRGSSVKAAATLSAIKIFPNPVRPDFTGLLSIEGLTDFADIKIATSAGRMVYSARVRGGKTTWNLRFGQGGKVSPGVYLVYVMDESGAQRVAGKFVVL